MNFLTLDPNEIADKSVGTINPQFSNKMDSELLAAGFSQEDIDKIKSSYDNVLTEDDSKSFTDNIKKHSDKIDTDATKIVTGNSANTTASDIASNMNAKTSYSYQDAQKGKIFPEPNAMLQDVTEMPDFPAANSELKAEYPNVYGKIDHSGNWYKVNKTTNYTEFVHSSGSSLKIDKAGNVSVHITGAFKLIVDDDHLINVGGNMDSGVVGNESRRTIGDLKVQSTKTVELSATQIATLIAAMIKIN